MDFENRENVLFSEHMNHYFHMDDNSKVVKLYLRRHQDTIVQDYNNDVQNILVYLNNNVYDNILTTEDLQIPVDNKNLAEFNFIFNLIHNEDIRMGTRSIEVIANKIRTQYRDRVDTENLDDAVNDMFHEYIANKIIPLGLRLRYEPEHNTPIPASRTRGAGKKRKKQSKKSKKKKRKQSKKQSKKQLKKKKKLI